MSFEDDVNIGPVVFRRMREIGLPCRSAYGWTQWFAPRWSHFLYETLCSHAPYHTFKHSLLHEAEASFVRAWRLFVAQCARDRAYRVAFCVQLASIDDLQERTKALQETISERSASVWL